MSIASASIQKFEVMSDGHVEYFINVVYLGKQWYPILSYPFLTNPSPTTTILNSPSYHIISYQIISYHIISHDIVSYQIIPYTVTGQCVKDIENLHTLML